MATVASVVGAPQAIAVGRVACIAAAAAIGGFLFGYDSAVLNGAVTVTFPPMLLHLGSGPAYGVYATFAAVAIVFVRRFVVETRGRTLEGMR